ncbi:MAG: PP2C family protein-serine/threonine phosphatase [Desulfobacteraceae bacterium]|jgi:sigma-B regulation protein RsbU (phosphoserine phosphatase)|nr:PP2C family protein-serine/threonine phosphatase [Desulfobacteraceae bacterium]
MWTELQNLKESNEFLNLLLNNMNSAVLIADENLKIHQFNDSFLDLFDKATESVLEASFGETVGCVNAIIENKSCGETSHCSQCILRSSLIHNLIDRAPVDNQPLNRIFYINGQPVEKHFQFSTRPINFQGRKMFLIIIYDVTEIELQKIELQRKQQLIDQDLKSAAAIQQSLLPARSPRIENVQVAWKFEPCEQIGGDIFNFHHMDERNVGLYMLDVCGHGVPAALISVAVSQFLNGADGLLGNNCELVSPDIVLNRLDHAFPFERFDSFFSIICMTLDISEGILTYSSAGHPPPVLVHSNGSTETLDHRGPSIGLGCEDIIGQQSIELQTGDKILLYTDGLIENRNSAGVFFGKQRFYDIVKKHRNESVQDIVETIYATVKEFSQQAKPDDDVSILGLEYCG